MNVTIRIEDELCKAARHRAVDRGLSLSGWIAEILKGELSKGKAGGNVSLLDAIGNNDLAGEDLEFPRDQSEIREVDFS